MLIKYRKAIIADIDDMFIIDNECFPEKISYPCKTFKEFLTLPENLLPFIEVAEKGDKIIGFIIGIKNDKDAFTIITIDVIKEYRGKKVAQALLEHLEKWYMEHEIKYGILQVSATNKQAIRFYEKNHYNLSRVLPHYYAEGEDGLEYIKEFI